MRLRHAARARCTARGVRGPCGTPAAAYRELRRHAVTVRLIMIMLTVTACCADGPGWPGLRGPRDPSRPKMLTAINTRPARHAQAAAAVDGAPPGAASRTAPAARPCGCGADGAANAPAAASAARGPCGTAAKTVTAVAARDRPTCGCGPRPVAACDVRLQPVARAVHTRLRRAACSVTGTVTVTRLFGCQCRGGRRCRPCGTPVRLRLRRVNLPA